VQYILFFLLPLFLLAKPFKVATYNVENLFDAEYAGTEYDDYQVKHNWTKRMVDIKLNHVAEVICDLDADILALQEIENENIFQQLKKKLEQVGCVYEYGVISSKKHAPIQVALLSKFHIKKTHELVVSPSSKVRNILEVQLDVLGHDLTVFVNHWKSRAYHGVESKRIKYAKVLDSRIKRLTSKDEYIILGDFNTDYDAHLGLESRLNDTEGKTGLHDILHISKNDLTQRRKLVHEHDMLQNKKKYHYTLWGELEYDKRWNTKFYGHKGTADHIILPHTLFDKQAIDYVNDSFTVFKDDYLFTKRGYIHRWQYKKGKHRGKGYSDHLPIYAFFDAKPYVENEKSSVKEMSRTNEDISYFYKHETLKHEVEIKNAVVVWKNRNNALIKQSKEGRGIFLFGCAKKLALGQEYDLLVRAVKNYKGLKELTQVYVLKTYYKKNIKQYFLNQQDLYKGIGQRQNEVIANVEGHYIDKHFIMQGLKIPIYFKSKKYTPSNGKKIKIHLGLLGYYKRLQLVIFSKKDFEIME
jgi:endonuclease/exonuclease/phosphatase family metal-dependent hydrolase